MSPLIEGGENYVSGQVEGGHQITLGVEGGKKQH